MHEGNGSKVDRSAGPWLRLPSPTAAADGAAANHPLAAAVAVSAAKVCPPKERISRVAQCDDEWLSAMLWEVATPPGPKGSALSTGIYLSADERGKPEQDVEDGLEKTRDPAVSRQ